MIIATLKMFPDRDKHRSLLDILLSVKEPVLAETGCASCCIYEEFGDETHLFYVEHWKSLPALERHLKGNNYARVLEAMELSTRAPEIFFHETTVSWGLELVERILTAEQNKYGMKRQ